MKIIKSAASIVHGIISLFGSLSGVFIVFMMIIITYEVVMRYFFDRPTTWVIEIAEYCLLYMAFLGAALVLRNEKHVKMDMVIEQFKPRAQLLINVITSTIGAIVFLIIFWYGAKVTWQQIQEGFTVPSYLMPPQALITGIIPLGSLFFSIQFLIRAFSYINKWKGSRKSIVLMNTNELER
ncbi:TRAP transporter small permease [Chloroflexota bacterium]